MPKARTCIVVSNLTALTIKIGAFRIVPLSPEQLHSFATNKAPHGRLAELSMLCLVTIASIVIVGIVIIIVIIISLIIISSMKYYYYSGLRSLI